MKRFAPESVRAFFLGTRYNETIRNFFGPPSMAARLAPLFGALLAGWHLTRHPMSPRLGRLRICRLRSRCSPPIEPAKGARLQRERWRKFTAA